MTVKKEEQQKVWEEIHEKLQTAMKQEILAMREILANMHQEELSLVSQDSTFLGVLRHERNELLTRLSNLRSIRLSFIDELSYFYYNKDNQKISIEGQLSDVTRSETLILCDQIIALAGKIHDQNQQNHFLAIQQRRKPYPMPAIDPKRRKIYLQTEEEG